MNKRSNKKINIFSIKNKMLGSLSAFSVIFLLVLCIISIYLASNSLLKNTQYFLKELTFSSSKILDERATSIFGKLEAFSNIPQIQDENSSYKSKIELFKNEILMQKQRGWINFGIAGKDGMLYRTDDKTENVNSADWYKKALKGKYVITEPAMSAAERTYVYAVAIPLRDLQGKIVGVISATLQGDSLSNLISDIIVGETGTAYLISPDGIILGNRRPEILYKSIFTEIINDNGGAYSTFLQKALKSNDATVNFSKLHKVNYVSAVATMRYSGWTLLITAPASEFIAENISNFISTFGFISLIQLFISIIIAVILASQIVRPINGVIAALKNISQGEGDLTIELPADGSDETSILSSYFNKTILKLRNSIHKVGKDSIGMKDIGTDLECNMVSVSEVVSKITESIEGLKQNFTQQEQSVAETASAIEQIIRTIRLLNESIGQQLSVVQESSSSFDRMNLSIETVGGNVKTTRDAIKKLAEVSSAQGKKITQTLKTLTGEIEILASSASGAVEKFNFISGYSEEVNGSIENVVHAMDEQEQTGKSIWTMIKEVTNLTKDVKRSSDEMLTGGEKIISETSRLDGLTKILRGSMDDIASQVELINSASEESLEIAKKNKESIDSLVLEVGKFKTEK